ncbi:MAG: HAD family hydrolase [Oscillospiraceae bacterium]|nr:HAD family hydrolase [Oscillospiraceae bacterium]
MKTVMFDLDGTLLPMNQDEFVNGYFSFLVKKMAPHGYEPQQLIKAIWGGTAAMVKNDGSCTNEEAFWRFFTGIHGENARADIPLFEEFYADDFPKARQFCGFSPKAAEAVALVKARGARPVLATNPLFPAVAQHHRIRWAGREPGDFELITTYENIGCCKPNTAYYEEILRRLGASGAECIMVGNDVDEDMVAEKLGVTTFLLTDCLINKSAADISRWPHGGFDELLTWLDRELR